MTDRPSASPEIRTSMYHSSFYEMLYRANANPLLRRLLGTKDPDLHMKDVEILLRGFALLIDGSNYAPSMVKFLNQFSRKARAHSEEQNSFLSDLMNSFLEACNNLVENAFLNKKSGRFNVALFEAAFVATCRNPFAEKRLLNTQLSPTQLANLEIDPGFVQATLEGTTTTRNVKIRLDRADQILGPH